MNSFLAYKRSQLSTRQ